MGKIILLSTILLAFIFQNQAQTISDIDGNIYDTVQIANQVWLKENLMTKHYNNGDSIGTTWPTTKDLSKESISKYQWPYNGDESKVEIYGRLYTWFTTNDIRGVCPLGWHIPNYSEWTTLLTNLGGEPFSSNHLKESGYTHWSSPNLADNSSDFTALPTGGRNYQGDFFGLKSFSGYWLSTEKINNNAWSYILKQMDSSSHFYNTDVRIGYSIRCVKNNTENGIENIILIKELKIYPNPTTYNITIDCTEKENKLYIYNLLGELVFQQQVNNEINEINVSNLQTGVYIIKLENEQGTIQQKLIKK